MKKEKPLLYATKFFLSALFCAVCIFLLGSIFTRLIKKNSTTSLTVSTNYDGICIVIDAGHGGEDPGAVSDDGTLEKDLNLEISKILFALCELNGNKAVMTRQDDTLLYDYYDDLDNYKGQKKVYDLKNRLKIAESVENGVYVGIHMNKFSQSKYSGAQIYYSKNNDLSSYIASNVAKSIKAYLQPNNNRQTKMAGSSIYILDKTKIPAILIECGFLSNDEELQSLKNKEYQASIAMCIFSSIINSDFNK